MECVWDFLLEIRIRVLLFWELFALMTCIQTSKFKQWDINPADWQILQENLLKIKRYV